MGKRQISPLISSKGVIDRKNKMWQFIIAKLKKGSDKYGEKVNSV